MLNSASLGTGLSSDERCQRFGRRGVLIIRLKGNGTSTGQAQEAFRCSSPAAITVVDDSPATLVNRRHDRWRDGNICCILMIFNPDTAACADSEERANSVVIRIRFDAADASTRHARRSRRLAVIPTWTATIAHMVIMIRSSGRVHSTAWESSGLHQDQRIVQSVFNMSESSSASAAESGFESQGNEGIGFGISVLGGLVLRRNLREHSAVCRTVPKVRLAGYFWYSSP